MPPTETDAAQRYEVTDEHARLLAAHAIHVQGGFSTPENERERLLTDLSRPGATPPDAAYWSRLQSEVDAALQAKAATLDPADGGISIDGEPVGDVDLAIVRKYKDLREAEKAADAEKSALKAEADDLESKIVEMFSEAGVPSMSIDGKTVYLQRKTYAQWESGLDLEEKKRLLREAGAGDLVSETINANTLAAWLRELLDVDEPAGLPEVLKAHLDLGERFGVQVRASASKSAATKRAAARSKS